VTDSTTVYTKPPFWARAKRALARQDLLLDAIIRAHPGIALRSRGNSFQTLARSIVGQQISLKAANSIWLRVCATAQTIEPAAILLLSPEQLQGCGLTRRKTEYIHDLARRFVDGSIHAQHWPQMDDEEIIAELVQVRGIGRWTAEVFLMFSLMRPDILPLDDLGLQRAVSHYYFHGEQVGAAGVRVVAEAWTPWRSVATWYMWRSLEPAPTEY
jgi:DNA-3-methyladenine glycosylase II